MKMKRKDDDDSEYLHSSPPTKSRRLLDYQITMEIQEDTHANLKDDYLLSQYTTKLEKLVEDETTRQKRSEVSKECLAIIPWVPNPIMAWEKIVPETGQTLEAESSEMMEMDEPYANNNNDKLVACGVSSPWQQQQQQCMMPNLFQPHFGMYFW